MIKTQVICDFCEKPIPEGEHNNVILTHRTKEFDTRKFYPHMCKTCAKRIDYILKAYKEDAAHRAGLASMYAQINKERKEQLGTEG